MKLQQLLSYVRKAVEEHQMISKGDRIAVGLSGGKDSLSMLYALHGLKRFYPNAFDLEAVTVDLGFDGFDCSKIREACDALHIRYTVVDTDIASVLFDIRQEKNPCSLCAKMRKGAFNEVIKGLGCNKAAYAHHKDDVIETSLMSLLYEGRYHAFLPVTYLDKMDLTVIRPMIYVDEADIIGFKNAYGLPVVKSPCPVDGYTKREYAKNLIKQLERENAGARERLFHSVKTYIWNRPIKNE